MKRVMILAATAACASVVFVSCGGSKNAPMQSVTDLDREIAMEKKRQELAELRQKSQMKEQLTNGAQVTLVFCLDEAMDRHGEYMAGLGISTNQYSEQEAMLNANSAAIADISSRFIGTIKNAVRSYGKDVRVPSNKKASENELERIATSVGEKSVNQYAEVACRKFTTLPETNEVKGYVAVHVPTGKVLNNIASELEKAKVDYDAEKFQDWMNKELDAQAAKNKAEIEGLNQ